MQLMQLAPGVHTDHGWYSEDSGSCGWITVDATSTRSSLRPKPSTLVSLVRSLKSSTTVLLQELSIAIVNNCRRY